jgi:hypothetical protein
MGLCSIRARLLDGLSSAASRSLTAQSTAFFMQRRFDSRDMGSDLSRGSGTASLGCSSAVGSIKEAANR